MVHQRSLWSLSDGLSRWQQTVICGTNRTIMSLVGEILPVSILCHQHQLSCFSGHFTAASLSCSVHPQLVMYWDCFTMVRALWFLRLTRPLRVRSQLHSHPLPGFPWLAPDSQPDVSTPASPEGGGNRVNRLFLFNQSFIPSYSTCAYLQRLGELDKVPLYSLAGVNLGAQADHLTPQLQTLLLHGRLTERTRYV